MYIPYPIHDVLRLYKILFQFWKHLKHNLTYTPHHGARVYITKMQVGHFLPDELATTVLLHDSKGAEQVLVYGDITLLTLTSSTFPQGWGRG